MSTNQTIFENWRAIPDAFMANGESKYDEKDGEKGYILCSKMYYGQDPTGKCCGISAKATGDASGLAQLNVMGVGGTAIVNLSLEIGVVHPCCPKRLYAGDAQGVVLHY